MASWIDRGWSKLKAFFLNDCGERKTFNVKRVGATVVASFFTLVAVATLFSSGSDTTFYRRTFRERTSTDLPEKQQNSSAAPSQVGSEAKSLFVQSAMKKDQERLQAEAATRHRVPIKYYAPQILGSNKAPKAIKAGAKLLGFLVNTIDTRDPQMVRVNLPKGGEVSGVEILPNSTLTGQFSYGGSGERLFVTFHRLDSPDGKTQKINAIALDSRDYTSGIRGEHFSENATKVVSQMGLSLFAGMAETLTEKESLGPGPGAVQAKPTMKNAILQGASKTAQEQAQRTSSEIGSLKDYVIVPEGNEMIIQLLEDFH